MYCTDFIFNNEKLSDYGFMICSFNNSDSTWSGGDISFIKQKTPKSDKDIFYTSSYNESLSVSFD